MAKLERKDGAVVYLAMRAAEVELGPGDTLHPDKPIGWLRNGGQEPICFDLSTGQIDLGAGLRAERDAALLEIEQLRAEVKLLRWETTKDPRERQEIEREWDQAAAAAQVSHG